MIGGFTIIAPPWSNARRRSQFAMFVNDDATMACQVVSYATTPASRGRGFVKRLHLSNLNFLTSDGNQINAFIMISAAD